VPAVAGSGFSVFDLAPLPLSCAGMGGTGGLATSRGTAMLSFRPGEKLYVRRRSGSRCSFFESLEDFRFVSRRLLLRSGPAEANSVPSCLAGSGAAPASCISDFLFSAPPVGLLRLLLLRKGHMPIVPFVLSTVQWYAALRLGLFDPTARVVPNRASLQRRRSRPSKPVNSPTGIGCKVYQARLRGGPCRKTLAR